MEADLTQEQLWQILGLATKLVLGFVLFPVHWIQIALYGRFTRFGRHHNHRFHSTLEGLIVDLVEQTQVHYRHLRFVNTAGSWAPLPLINGPYSWILFTMLTITATPLVCGDMLAWIMASGGHVIIHLLMTDINRPFVRSSDYLKSFVGAVSIVKTMMLMSILFAYQAVTITFPYMLHLSGALDLKLEPQAYFVDNVIVMPIVQSLWIGLVHLTAQERMLQLVQNADEGSDVLTTLMFPLWLWTWSIRAIMESVRMVMSAIATAYVIGASLLPG
jgi:hypothetical protein